MSDSSTMASTSNTVTNGKQTEGKGNKKPVKRRPLPNLPQISGAESCVSASLKARVDKAASDWMTLENYEVCALASDGTGLLVKVSKSRAIDLVRGKAINHAGGRVYRVSISA